MSKSFKEVLRLQCNHCGKLFKTERHDCKFDPEKRNCLTCQHNLGQLSEDGVAFFECAKGHTEDWVEIITIQSLNWKMDCKDWQLANWSSVRTMSARRKATSSGALPQSGWKRTRRTG